MELQRIKLMVAVLWVLVALVIATAVELSRTGGIALALVASLPPLAMLLLWKDPAPTMSESIRNARR